MPPKNKAKAAGVSASSFFDLKAEIAKQEAEFAKSKAAGKSTARVQKAEKKQTKWARPNKGVKARAELDIELEAVSKPTIESARAALERKAKIYEKLKKGKTGGLSDAQYDALLVDFDSMPPGDRFGSGSEDEDGSLTDPNPSGDDPDDPLVEYEDEFGRIRTALRSEVPRHLAPDNQLSNDDEDVIYNPVNHFPIYTPSAERVEAIAEAHSEASNPLGVHYDASTEVRAKGAGFYQFSADEETRKQQMEELKDAREETERTRMETRAVDLRPGETEGMRGGLEGDGVGTSRAMEKRKRELEERRKLLDAKRRKVAKSDTYIILPKSVPTFEARAGGVEDHKHEVLILPNVSRTIPSPVPRPADSFAVLQTKVEGNEKGEAVSNAADDFLAQLEKDILNSDGMGR